MLRLISLGLTAIVVAACAAPSPPPDHPPADSETCADDAMVCADGSTVTRTCPGCRFGPCPDMIGTCEDDALVCPDGSSVGRTGPCCEFAPCPG